MNLKHFFLTLARTVLLLLHLFPLEVVNFDAKKWNWKENRNEFARIFS